MKLVNLTPHEITVCGKTIPPSGTVARLASTMTEPVVIEGLTFVSESLGEPIDLPERDRWADTLYIVSKMVVDAMNYRPDLAYPTKFVRDDKGRIIGAEALAFSSYIWETNIAPYLDEFKARSGE